MAATMREKGGAAKPNLQRAIVTLCFLLVLAVFVVIWLSPARGHDWRDSFAPAGRRWWDPYQVPFHNPPWVALLLWPVALLPLRAGFIVNGLLAIVVTIWLFLREGGSWLAIMVTLLSLPFIGTQPVGNIEWIPILGILIGGAWSVPFLMAKPQTIGPEDSGTWNLSAFRWGVPLGIICAWLAWKRDALHWVLLAGILLTPCFGIGSPTPSGAQGILAGWES